MDRTHAIIGLAVGCGVAMIAGTCSMLDVEVPPPPPPPPPIEHAAVTEYRYQESLFRAQIVEDARRFGLASFDPDSLKQPNPYFPEFRGRQPIKPGKPPLQTEHLRIGAIVSKESVSAGAGDTYRAPHLVLRIENKTDDPLAYLVETALTDIAHCDSKGAIPGDALAILPHETIERTECIDRAHNDLYVTRVDVMRLTALGHRYVSRLLPWQIGLEPRTSDGHQAPPGYDQPCGHVPAQELDGPGGRLSRWADVIDFYSRHNCDEYYFYRDYHRVTEPLARLAPFHAESAPSAPSPGAANGGGGR